MDRVKKQNYRCLGIIFKEDKRKYAEILVFSNGRNVTEDVRTALKTENMREVSLEAHHIIYLLA